VKSFDSSFLGQPYNDTHCVLVLRQVDLLAIAPDPMKLDNDKKSSIENLDTIMLQLRNLRLEIQRSYKGEKLKNVWRYARYLANIRGAAGMRKRDGFAPPMTLYYPHKLVPTQEGDLARFSVPRSALFIAIDGDTQLAARHQMFKTDPSTGDDLVSVTLIHGEDVEFARQAFSDVNTYGHKVPPELAILRDTSTPIVQLAKDFVAERRINTDDRLQPSLKTMTLATKAFCGGLERASSKEDFAEEVVDPLRDPYFAWFGAVFDLFNGRPDDDPYGVAASQTAMVALGHLGYLVHHDHNPSFKVAIDSLKRVDWTQGDHWLDVASMRSNRKRDTGALIIAGSHAYWRATAEALSNPNSALYRKVRHLSGRAAS
jgi:DNA sulfur modification protein DndB